MKPQEVISRYTDAVEQISCWAMAQPGISEDAFPVIAEVTAITAAAVLQALAGFEGDGNLTGRFLMVAVRAHVDAMASAHPGFSGSGMLDLDKLDRVMRKVRMRDGAPDDN